MKKAILFILLFATCLFGYSPAITNFNTGQTSPYMEARSDFPKYMSSCRTLENMLILAQGPVMRRPGTKYIATSKTANSILVPFEYSISDTYILEFGDLYIRFYREGGQILDDSNAVYEITTVFDTNELPNLRYVQADNTMYIVDGNDPPQKLTRTAHTSWTIADCNITTGPFRAENTEDINITPSAATGSITLTANSSSADANIFHSGHTGSIWKIKQRRNPVSYTGNLTATDQNSVSTIFFKGNYSFTTTIVSAWTFTVALERTTDNGTTWMAALAPLNATNFDNPSETEEDGAIYRVISYGAGSGNARYALILSDIFNDGIVKITDVNNGTTAKATVLVDLVDANSTKKWSEGYWSDYRGWPKTVAFHQQRLVFGGSETFPQTLWFGKQNPDDYTNFTEGTLDTSPFTVTIQGQNPITWLQSGDYLFIGTSGSCGKYGKQGEGITPTSPSYSEQTKIGSDNISAVFAGDSILYVERGGRKIREFAYSLQYDKYLSPDITVLSEDITKGGIKDIAFQMRPIPILWCVLNDGNMATLTFQRDQEVISWSLQHTQGNFESVAVIPTTQGADEVWVEAERILDGNSVYYIEQFQPLDWGADDNDCFFVDSGLIYDGNSTDNFSGLDHLEGRTVSIYADGIVCPDVNVEANSVTIINSANYVVAGLSYTSKLETMPLTIDIQDKAMHKKINYIAFDFYKTGYCEYGNGENSDLIPINFFEGGSFVSAKQPLWTSENKKTTVKFPYGSKQKSTVYLQTDKPLPMMIREIVPKFELDQ